jgi:putative PIN family toxin of toxin-antitoxin system
MARSFVCITSAALLDELERVLQYSRVQRYLSWSADERAEFVGLVRRHARLVQPAETLTVIEDDPADNRVLEAAAAGGAEYIVSGDRHLLELGGYGDIAIVTPARFVAVLRAD